MAGTWNSFLLLLPFYPSGIVDSSHLVVRSSIRLVKCNDVSYNGMEDKNQNIETLRYTRAIGEGRGTLRPSNKNIRK